MSITTTWKAAECILAQNCARVLCTMTTNLSFLEDSNVKSSLEKHIKYRFFEAPLRAPCPADMSVVHGPSKVHEIPYGQDIL